MVLKVLSSGSKGNCYLLEDETECLIIEAGVSFPEVKKALDFNISKIVGVVVSHEHGDHAKYVSQYIKAGIPVYTSPQTKEAIKQTTIAIQPLEKVSVGNFTFKAFEVPHEADMTCYGYLIQHKEFGKLLFLTDLEYCRYNFQKQKINHIMVECNYAKEFLTEINESSSKRNHVLTGHCELQTTINLIHTNDNPALRNIFLLHLSKVNSDPQYFLQKIKDITDKEVYIASKGLCVDINLIPF